MEDNKKAWDNVFKEHGRVFDTVHTDVETLAQDLKPADGKRIFDLGSGSGRHVVYLAKEGFDVYGFDYAEQGITMTREWLDAENVSADLKVGDMTQPLPYEDDFFDAVISIQVIHHAYLETVEAIISELARILKPNGEILITVAMLKNQATNHQEVAPNTFIPLDGWEKGLPHYFFDETQMRKSFSQFDIQDIRIDHTNHRLLIGTLKA